METANGFTAFAVAGIAGIFATGVMLAVTRMVVHLGIERTFGNTLGSPLEKTIFI